jgi:hypothetical protein
MRGRLLAVALGIVVLAALLVRLTGRGAAWAPLPAVPSRRAVAPPTTLREPAASPWAPSRNLFEYADERMPAPLLVPAPAAPPRAETLAQRAAPAPAVRVVGLIRRGGRLEAALIVHGEMMVAGAGARAGGYTVLAVDEDAGVRLRGPAGEEIVLPPPSF